MRLKGGGLPRTEKVAGRPNGEYRRPEGYGVKTGPNIKYTHKGADAYNTQKGARVTIVVSDGHIIKVKSSTSV